jgi:transcriptional regulator with XRE-family HTH domain
LANKPPNSAYPKKLVTLGDHIRKRRLDLGLFQKDMAVTIGVDTTTIYNWENNRTAPPARFIPKISIFLGYEPGGSKPVTFGEKIRRYRYLRGISQKELARQMEIDPTTLSRLERDLGRSTSSVTRKAMILLKASAADLTKRQDG